MTNRVGQQLGNYRLLRVLGQGSFAEVYLAEHQYLERLAAIKVLYVQIDAKTQEQFRREARMIAHLHHPHIVQVLEFGLDNQTPYLVMEYTPGGTLRSQYPTGTRLPLEQIVTSVKQIASALDYAHQQRVIHRDVKPDNLLLNANHEVLLSDFGIAVVQLTLDSPSVSHPEAGTPLYMAPEQIQQQPCAASDQYALGIMVYEWLAGEAPFRGTLFEVFSQHLHQPPPSLCERLLGLPLAVEETVFKALAKDPAQRFASVTDFAQAFEEACDVTQTLALPWLPKQPIHEPLVSYSTQVVSLLTAREQEASTQPAPMTMQRIEHGEEAVLVMTPGPSQPRLAVSKPVNLSLAQSNRHRFLRRVRAFWIDGVLEHSLQGAALIALGLQEQLDALANPWHLVLHHPDSAPRSFPLGTRISEVYDAANGQLLILGAPGSGKTTLVLELARDLLARAEQDEQQQMPVIFTLSSWSDKQQPLAEWMIEELINKYQVPRQLAHVWVETDQLLPLLDGLDEVETLNRTKCIETINIYHQEHAFLPLVVSSRSADYLQQMGRVRLTSAVTIQSLTQQQVDDYLVRGGESLWALRVAFHQDATLRELAETPLMLSILTLTYHDMPVEDLLQGGVAPTRQQVFEHYVGRMLERRSGNVLYQPKHTKDWLAWLARQLVRHRLTVFYIEQMQQDWLYLEKQPHCFSLQCITRFLNRIFVGLLSGGIVGAFLGLISGLLLGLVNIIFGGAVFDSTNVGFSIGYYELHLSHGGVYVLASGLSCMIAMIIIGLFGGLASTLKKEIHPVEAVAWSWIEMQRRWRYWLTGMLVGGLIFGLIDALAFVTVGGSDSSGTTNSFTYSIPLISKLVIGLNGALLGGLIGGFLGGVSRMTLNARTRVRANQGIWRSLQYSMLFGVLGGAITVLNIIPIMVWIFEQLALQMPHDRWPLTVTSIISPDLYNEGLILGLLITACIGLIYGGVACLQHLNLRLLLWVTKRIPWNYSRFLDYAAEHILLRKVGGGYIFVHRLLLEYFASLDTTSPPDVTRAKKRQA